MTGIKIAIAALLVAGLTVTAASLAGRGLRTASNLTVRTIEMGVQGPSARQDSLTARGPEGTPPGPDIQNGARIPGAVTTTAPFAVAETEILVSRIVSYSSMKDYGQDR